MVRVISEETTDGIVTITTAIAIMTAVDVMADAIAIVAAATSCLS